MLWSLVLKVLNKQLGGNFLLLREELSRIGLEFFH